MDYSFQIIGYGAALFLAIVFLLTVLVCKALTPEPHELKKLRKLNREEILVLDYSCYMVTQILHEIKEQRNIDEKRNLAQNVTEGWRMMKDEKDVNNGRGSRISETTDSYPRIS